MGSNIGDIRYNILCQRYKQKRDYLSPFFYL
jgi:hypothetical protein